VNAENDVISDVAKRQKTVEQYGVGGLSPQPQLDPHASSHSATHDEMFRRMEFEGEQQNLWKYCYMLCI
jgi:hypothetical protein